MYDTFSQEYDHFVNWTNRLEFELPFLMEQINSAATKPGGQIKILDTATGTGMHAIALAQKGYSASGVDISEGMITAARKNAAAVKADVFFTTAAFGGITGKLKNFPEGKGGPFDVVLCLGNSLPHVEGPAGLKDALYDFAGCLRPGGLLILQNRNFDSVLEKKERWMEPQSYKGNGEETLFMRFYDFLPDGHIQFNIVTLKRTPQGGWNQSIMESRLFPISREILVPALEDAGFSRIRLFGALSDTPFESQTSGNLVVSAIKK
jgi:glycine/sarcosine N-methyltransferase